MFIDLARRGLLIAYDFINIRVLRLFLVMHLMQQGSHIRFYI